jgi:hypothetical protein
LWQDGSPWWRLRYINNSSSWLAGGLDFVGDDSWEMGLGERLLDGWILHLLVPLVEDLQETHGVDVLQDYTSQGTAVRILIWDPGIGVLGSLEFDGWILHLLVPLVEDLQETHGVDVLQDYTSQGTAVRILIWDPGIGVLGSLEFDGVDIRVERLLEELIEDLLHMIILLIRSIWVSCVMSTWSCHDLRGAYYMSHRWIWDPDILLIQLWLEDKQHFSREDCNVPIFGCCYVTEWGACQSSQMGLSMSSGDIEGVLLGPTYIVHHISSSGSILHNLAFGSVAF